MAANTRQKERKYTLHSQGKDHVFKPKDSFPSTSVLPTGKDVIESVIFPTFWRAATTKETTNEIIAQWIYCSVYSLDELTVRKKVNALKAEFIRLIDYPKKKRETEVYKDKVGDFLTQCNKLFDVFPNEKKALEESKERNKFIMTDDEYSFLEDQRTTRMARNLSSTVKPNKKEVQFQKSLQRKQLDKNRQKKAQEATRVEPSNQGDMIPNDQLEELDSDFPSETSSSSSQGPSDDPDNTLTDFNMTDLRELPKICDRFNVSDRVGAAVATATLVDYGLITSDDETEVISRMKLRRSRQKYREDLQQEETKLFDLVDSIFVDGKRDATLIMSERIVNGKPRYYRSLDIEEHYVIIGEPGEFYLSHVTPEDGRGATIGRSIYDAIADTTLVERLAVVGSDGTSVMTGYRSGCIRILEELCGRPLTRAICLLHTNELPLRHVFMEIDGTTKSPDAFSGPIGSLLDEVVSYWGVTSFTRIVDTKFLDNLLNYPNKVVEDLSTDQYYAYRICMGVMTGEIPEDLSWMEVGPLCHSRWLTLGCRILRYYVSVDDPSEPLRLLAEYCIKVYFPSWFHIKKNKYLTDGPKNFHFMVDRIMKLSHPKIRNIALHYLEINSFHAHPENILLSMCSDEDARIRNVAVNKILKIRGNLDNVTREEGNLFQRDFRGGFIDVEEDDNEVRVQNIEIRPFKPPKIYRNAKSYYKLVDMRDEFLTEPPILINYTDEEIIDIRKNRLILKHPCHSQAVERAIKVVSEASSQVVGFKRRDGHIRQKLKSRSQQKRFNAKKDFNMG